MLRRALQDNNYPNWLIKKTFNRFKFSKIEKQKEKQKLQRNSNPILFTITKQNIRVYTKSLQTIKQILPNLKDPIEPKQLPGVIYQIPC